MTIKSIIDFKNSKNHNYELVSESVKNFFQLQVEKWALLKENLQNLNKVDTREFEFDNFTITAQFNQSRIKSTTALVDEISISNRKCFLCLENLPAEQIALPYEKNYLILCNPYPIFPEHFTITKTKHKSQTIVGSFEDMLNLSRDLSKYYTIFYNGPECGASAPDHMHFQAVLKDILPLEKNIEKIKNSLGKPILIDEKLEIHYFEDYPAKFFLYESDNKGELLYAFKIFFNNFRKISRSKLEPMFNIICKYDNEKWYVVIFPRSKHRPLHYFEKDEKKFLISPAAVDLGGLIAVVRKEDFKKLNKKIILEIFKQVTLSTEYFEYLKKKLTETFAIPD